MRTSKITNVSAVQELDGTNHPREPFVMHKSTKDGEEDESSGCSSKRALGSDNGIEDIYSKDSESSRPSGDIYPIVVGKAQIRRISNLFQGEDTSEHEYYMSVTQTSRNGLPSTQNNNSTHRREKFPIPKYLKQSPKYPIFVKFDYVSFSLPSVSIYIRDPTNLACPSQFSSRDISQSINPRRPELGQPNGTLARSAQNISKPNKRLGATRIECGGGRLIDTKFGGAFLMRKAMLTCDGRMIHMERCVEGPCKFDGQTRSAACEDRSQFGKRTN